MPLFWNSIDLKLSYAKWKLKKKNVELEFMELKFHT